MTAKNTDGTCAQCRRGHHDQCSDPDTCSCPECAHGLVEWEDPAPGRGRAAVVPVSDAQLELLRAHPKRWAKVLTYTKDSSAGSTAGRIRKGAYPAIDPGDFEAVARRTDGGSALYLRYVGEP